MFLRSYFLLVLLSSTGLVFSQSENKNWKRAFPITNYIVALSDSVDIVQVKLPAGAMIAEKQLGLLRGTYREKFTDTLIYGTGRCHLIKGDYYYFSIAHNKNAGLPTAGDLLYTLGKQPSVYNGYLIKLASYYILLQNVYEDSYYNRDEIFIKWSKDDEKAALDSMLADIKFTANYFLKEQPSLNVAVKGGRYDGKMVLNAMITSTLTDLTDFLDYIYVKPLLYAGSQWKISEVFATWLSSGAPTVTK